MDSAPQPSEAEGKPVPAPNPPIPDELIDILIDHHVDFKMLDQLYEAITRLYAGREARHTVAKLETEVQTLDAMADTLSRANARTWGRQEMLEHIKGWREMTAKSLAKEKLL